MANRFWVGGTGTWDASDTTHWAATTGAAGGQSVPVAGDVVTFDGSSGGGTVTVNHATLNVASITMGAFTGTLDFATNDNNITLTSSFSNNGSGTRTLNMGDGTWTVSGNSGNLWFVNGATNLTLNCNGSTIVFSGASSTTVKTIPLGAYIYNVVTLGASAAGYTFGGAFDIATLNVTGPTTLNLSASTTQRVRNAFNISGASSTIVGFQSSTFGTSTTIQLDANSTMSWCAFRDITFTTSSLTATNSFDLGRNTLSGGGSISAPSGGGGGGGQRVISG